MKNSILLILAFLGVLIAHAQKDPGSRYWQDRQTFNAVNPEFRYWQVGFGLGEIPMHGSFKPSLTFGYHINDKFYLGVIYQFRDDIHRGTSSFNAEGTGLTDLTDSRETVGQRFMLQCRYTPVKYAPYISLGVVFNDVDREVMYFGNAEHQIGNNTYNAALTVTQCRPAGWAPAIGLGYQADLKCGLSFNAEWTPGWFVWVPEPDIQIESGTIIEDADMDLFKKQVTKDFQSHVTNLYKVFHFGVSYRF